MATKLDLDLITRETAANFAAVSLLPNAEFARQPNKGIDGKKPKCKDTSHSCGFTCISGKKTCRITMTMEQQQAAKKLKAELRAAKKKPEPTPPPEPPKPEQKQATKKQPAKKQAAKEQADGRNPKLAKAIADLDKKIEIVKSRILDDKGPKEAYFKADKEEGESPKDYKARMDKLRAAWQKTDKALGLAKRGAEVAALNILLQLPKKSPEEALDIVKQADIKYTTRSPGEGERELSSGAKEEAQGRLAIVVELTGQLPSTLKRIEIDPNPEGRAFARKFDGVISYRAKDFDRVLFHEFAHHVEFSDPDIASAAVKWRDEKATSKKLVKLSELTKEDYGDGEVALRDHYYNPYVGKVYQTSATEVVSMGFDHFASPDLLVELRARDPSHFNFIMEKVLKV
jgi:hypothetical protein